jgi:diguanylate cyclase (GGDEF)-like protein
VALTLPPRADRRCDGDQGASPDFRQVARRRETDQEDRLCGILRCVTSRWQPGVNGTPGVPGTPALERDTDHRIAALSLASPLFLGGLLGAANLLTDGVVREGATRWAYGSVMAVCLAASAVLAARRRIGRWETFGLVLLGHLVYLTVALSVQDPARYASPLLLLVPLFVAAWFLGRWELAVTMALTTASCVVALWAVYATELGLVIQVCVSAGTLNAGALAIFLVRRRVQRLLADTQSLSNLDPLTGLFNRRYLVQQAARVWRQARRDGTRVAAMVLDLDHFKLLNDAHGHAAGDAVLQGVARALAATVRPADVLARTGGEELVVLGLVGDPDEARRLAERLRAAVASSRDHGHQVTASIGVALTSPTDGEDPTDALWRLIDRADVAMYEAKQKGRNRVAQMGIPRAPGADPSDNPAVPGPPAPELA